MANNFHQGIFKPQFPEKYKNSLGEKNPQIIYRSGWELRAMKWFDQNPAIKRWSSESIIIPYVCPTDDKSHRYFVDFYVETDDKKFLVEIKPEKQTVLPKYPGKTTKRYLIESATYLKNTAKWAAARKYCDQRGWKFLILTEVHLGLKK